MQVRVDKFCSLSTSPSWQAWLFHLDMPIYRRFMRRLQESRGCNQNKDIMVELLKELEKVPDAVEKLFEFLTKHYPHMIVKDAQSAAASKKKVSSAVFQYYNPNIRTYPRRQIFEGKDLEKQVREFLLDKIKSDYVIVDGRAYVEYLEQEDAKIAAKVPVSNWQIAAWRLKSEQN